MSSLVKVWELEDPKLPKELFYLKDIFLAKIKKEPEAKPRGDRKPGESLHDYLTRKNIPCFCRPCQTERKAKAQENNATLI